MQNQNQTSLPEGFDLKVPDLKPDEKEKYHAFLSHGSDDADVKIAKTILQALEDYGFKCFDADRDFEPGASITANMAVGIMHSKKVIQFVTQSFLKSKYCDFEVAEALHQSFEKQKRVMIPLLIDVEPCKVPSSIKEINYIELSEPNYFQRLVEALISEVPLSATIPAGNVAHGLAWSYYYGYLKIILPEFRERVGCSEWNKKGIPMLKKFVCILSETANCPGRMCDEDEKVETLGDVVHKCTVAGNVERDYSHKVHKVKHPDTGKEYLFPGEFCTPLRSMFQMEQDGIAGLSREQRVHQTMLFRDKLKEILNHPKTASFCNNILLVDYRDEVSQSASEVHQKDSLSRVLADAIAHEMDKEKNIEKEKENVEKAIAKHGTPV